MCTFTAGRCTWSFVYVWVICHTVLLDFARSKGFFYDGLFKFLFLDVWISFANYYFFFKKIWPWTDRHEFIEAIRWQWPERVGHTYGKFLKFPLFFLFCFISISQKVSIYYYINIIMWAVSWSRPCNLLKFCLRINKITHLKD